MALLNHEGPFWALLAAAPLVAMVSTASHAQTWKINLRDADLTAFINEVADITGKNFAVDPRVRGNVTVISNKALNKNEVYDLISRGVECEWCGGYPIRKYHSPCT